MPIRCIPPWSTDSNPPANPSEQLGKCPPRTTPRQRLRKQHALQRRSLPVRQILTRAKRYASRRGLRIDDDLLHADAEQHRARRVTRRQRWQQHADKTSRDASPTHRRILAPRTRHRLLCFWCDFPKHGKLHAFGGSSPRTQNYPTGFTSGSRTLAEAMLSTRLSRFSGCFASSLARCSFGIRRHQGLRTT